MATHNGQRAGKRAFTLIELLVVVAIISILASILFPVFARARESARRASCLSNLKQIGLGMLMYAQDYDDTLPMLSNCGATTLETGVAAPLSSTCTGGQGKHLWYHSVFPYIKSIQIYNCPSVDYVYKSGGYTGKLAYGLNRTPFDYLASQNGNSASDNVLKLASVERASESLLIAESVLSSGSYLVSRTTVDARHLETFNAVFFDGHAKNQRFETWQYDKPAGEVSAMRHTAGGQCISARESTFLCLFREIAR